jgi:hypothetical protein
MNFTGTDVEKLRAILTLCKTVGVDSCVLSDGKVMGMSTSRKLAIISESGLTIDPEVAVGIGRLSELEKRFGIFGDDVGIVGEIGKGGEVSRLTLQAGRSKAQFRCTATSLIKYPKENADTPFAVVSLSKAEVAQLVRGVRTFGAENIIFKISAKGDVHIEFVDSTNDHFATGTEKSAEFIGEAEAVLFTYTSSYLTTIMDVGTRDADSIDLVFGQAGSITALVRGLTLLIMPNINED